jgi:hypothetical protein
VRSSVGRTNDGGTRSVVRVTMVSVTGPGLTVRLATTWRTGPILATTSTLPAATSKS